MDIRDINSVEYKVAFTGAVMSLTGLPVTAIVKKEKEVWTLEDVYFKLSKKTAFTVLGEKEIDSESLIKEFNRLELSANKLEYITDLVLPNVCQNALQDAIERLKGKLAEEYPILLNKGEG